MRRSNCCDARDYRYVADEVVLLDANVLIYMYSEFQSDSSSARIDYRKVYTNAFAQLLQAGAKPVTLPIIISEYINSCIRCAHRASTYTEYKDFRKSQDFTLAAQKIALSAKKMITIVDVLGKQDFSIDALSAVTQFQHGELDFNDAIIAQVCAANNCKLMTNDGDFEQAGIEILTCNRKLLKA